MATVRMLLKHTDRPSEEQLERLHESKDRPAYFDEDSPEMTEDMLAQFKRVLPKEAVTSHAT